MGYPTKADTASIKTIIGESTYHQFLAEFPDLTRPLVFGEGRTRHDVKRQDHPSTARRLVPNRLKQVKAEFEMMLEQGVIVIEEPVGIVLDVHPCTSSPKKTEDCDRATTTER